MLPTTGDETNDAVLKVLRTERKKERCNEIDDDTGGPSTTGHTTSMADAAGQSHSLGTALKILVQNATEEFGFAPRDVYDGVFDLPETMKKHAIAVKLFDYSKLTTLTGMFAIRYDLDAFSHRVVVVRPTSFLYKPDMWLIVFKSIRIARKVVELMLSEEDSHLWKVYRPLQRGGGSTLAGWLFEAIVHRMFSGD